MTSTISDREALASVIQLHPTRRPGWLPYRWADAGRSFDALVHRAMAQIENMAALAFEAADGDADAAYTLLAANGCRFTADQVERLFQLSTEAGELQNRTGGRDFYYAVDSYTDYLHHLALAVRGGQS